MRGENYSVTRVGRRAIAAVIFCCVMLLTAYAQTGAQKEKQDDAALELKLTAYEESVCPGATLTLSLEITNAGERQLKILRSDLWNGFGYSQVGRARGGAEVGCGGDDAAPGGWIVLEPGDRYFDTMAYTPRTTFFNEAGRYKIHTSLSYYVADRQAKTITSSDAEFEIQDCAAK